MPGHKWEEVNCMGNRERVMNIQVYIQFKPHGRVMSKLSQNHAKANCPSRTSLFKVHKIKMYLTSDGKNTAITKVILNT